MNDINHKLLLLRIKWKKHPELRDLIERQAKALMYANKSYRIPKDENHEKRVEEIDLDELDRKLVKT